MRVSSANLGHDCCTTEPRRLPGRDHLIMLTISGYRGTFDNNHIALSDGALASVLTRTAVRRLLSLQS